MKTLLALLTLGTTLAFAGCAVEPTPADPRVTLEPDLAQYIIVAPVLVRHNDAGIPEIAATVRRNEAAPSRDTSRSNSTAKNDGAVATDYEYRVTWKDAKGFPINTVIGTWNHFTLLPNAQYTFRVVGPSRDAADFNIYLRRAPR
ncbi:MAG: YcfL family protein [Puniceicoccales bacterium]|jgi:uncharacterized protein YcfL|nr:YcfL family protein [Puniceicoccales bacterium]